MRFSFDFKFFLFLILGVCCVMVGGEFGFVSAPKAVSWIRFAGYWMILLCFVAWVIGCVRAYPSVFKKEGWSWLGMRKHRWGIVLALVLFVLAQFQVDKSFKILLDEPVLMNTSRMMHFDREVMVISNSHRVDGILAARGYVDKRPMFFPFLLSIVHDVTGYRVENAFYLNAVLLLALFGLTYAVGYQLAGRSAGLMALALIGSVPLVWHQAAGGGFEILNLVMILLTMKMAIDYLQRPGEKLLSALVLTTVMLSQVRYEGALFIIPVGMVVLMGYSLKKKGMLPWGMWLAPVMLVPLLWQMRVFEMNPDFWELFSVAKAAPFSLDYIQNNAFEAFYFFFEWFKQLPNSPVVAFIGLLSVVAFLVPMLVRFVNDQKRAHIIDSERPVLVFFVFALGFALYYLMLLCYAFDLGRYMVVRLTLPLYLLLALAGGLVCGGWLSNRHWHKIIFSVVALNFVGWTLPSVSSAQYASLYFPEQEAKIVDDYVKEKIANHERFLMVADMSMLWTSYDVEAIPNVAVNNQLSTIKYFLEQPNNIPIYVCQSMIYSPLHQRYADLASDPLDNRLVLKTLFERHISSFRVLRISQLMDVENVEAADDSEMYGQGDSDSDVLKDWVKMMP